MFWFQSGKLVTKMFQKIQDLIDDKDALVFVLIDEVGMFRHQTCGGGNSRLSASYCCQGAASPSLSPASIGQLLSHAALSSLPSHMLSSWHTWTPDTHSFVHSLAHMFRGCPVGPGAVSFFHCSVPTGGEPHSFPQCLQGRHRAFRCHPCGQRCLDPNRSN